MKILGIIPARYASSRFPGKPLAIIQGKPMIQRVYEQCIKAKSIDRVIVATDNNRIENVVKNFGGLVSMTSTLHESGTERCEEVVQKLKSNGETFDVVVNIQGDEPFVKPEQIDLLTSCFSDKSVNLATLRKRIESITELNNPNVVKVIPDSNGNAIYFSRQPIPFIRGKEKKHWLKSPTTFYKHIGIYAYRKDFLLHLTKLKPGKLEKVEKLEQLRVLEHGFKIRTVITDYQSRSIDTNEDLIQMNKFISDHHLTMEELDAKM